MDRDIIRHGSPPPYLLTEIDTIRASPSGLAFIVFV